MDPAAKMTEVNAVVIGAGATVLRAAELRSCRTMARQKFGDSVGKSTWLCRVPVHEVTA